MADLRRIDPSPFRELAGDDLPSVLASDAPTLRWLPIEELFVDPRYQRDLGKTGAKNIVRIAREFDWAKFAPVIVAPLKPKGYAIVDGQHRVTGAALCGIKKVPCQIIVADMAAQAAAFAAINANVTEMSPMQVHAAKVAAGDKRALALTAACKQAGIIIMRYPLAAKNLKLGETMAVGTLYRLLDRYKEDILVTALSCITRTRNGYPGFIRSQLVTALCTVLQAAPDYVEHRGLLAAIGKLDLAEAFQQACARARGGSTGGIIAALVERIGAHLKRELVAQPVRAKAPPIAVRPAAPAPTVRATASRAPLTKSEQRRQLQDAMRNTGGVKA